MRKPDSLAAQAPAIAAVLSTALAGACGPAIAQQNIRPPDEVFEYAVTATADEILFDFDVLDTAYLYRDRFKFESATPAVSLGQPVFPRGESHSDEFFGEQEIFRGTFEIAIPYVRTAPADTAEIALGLQGCDDAIGLCYPPQDWSATVSLPPGPAASAAAGRTTGLTGSLFAGSDSEEPLPVDQAFIANPRFDSANALTVSWQIAPGYYLYRDKFSFAVDGGIQLGTPRLPEGVERSDQSFGDVEVYYDNVDIVVPFARANPDAQPLAITVGFQGCKDGSICYPPDEQRFDITLPAASSFPAESAPADVGSAATAEQTRLSALILGDSWLGFLGAFYVAGLALSLTPCVLPMVPILSSIVAGQGKTSTSRGFWLSVSYVLGMAVTYTIAGALAALAGSQVQAAFQKPWIVSAFAGLFVVMALGMFGLFEIQMPAAIQSRLSGLANRQKAGTFLGTAVIGSLTALIVTTCVAPALIVALAAIGQRGDVVRGASALFVLAIGMGTPLLLVGASAGRLLPRVGPWMNTVKAGFGVVMIGLAIWMLERILPGTVTLVLWALLVFLSGVFLGAFDALPAEPTPSRRLAKGIGVLACLYGALMLIGAKLGGGDPLDPIPSVSSGLLAQPAASRQGLDFVAVESVAQLQTLLGQAKAAGQPVMIDFTADWCADCKKMEAYTFPDASVVAALEPFMLLRADVTANNADDKALLRYFETPGPPTIAFFDRSGRAVNPSVVGYTAADDFAAHVSSVAAM